MLTELTKPRTTLELIMSTFSMVVPIRMSTNRGAGIAFQYETSQNISDISTSLIGFDIQVVMARPYFRVATK